MTVNVQSVTQGCLYLDTQPAPLIQYQPSEWRDRDSVITTLTHGPANEADMVPPTSRNHSHMELY